MKTGPNGFALIKHFEQCRLMAFKPVLTDPWTIGWGRTCNVNAGDICTREQADDWLLQDVGHAEKAVDALINVQLTQNQYDALVSFTYNLGAGRLENSTLRKKLNSGDKAGASDEFPRWNKSAGMPLAGLTKRREAERKLFLTPDAEKFVL